MRRAMVTAGLLLWAALAGCASEPISQPDPPLWGGLRRGPHPVGFRADDILDVARDRRLRVGVWYPATAAGSDRPIELGHYLRLLNRDASDAVDDTLDLALLALQVNSAAPHLLPEEGLAQLARMPAAAIADAPRAAGDFPLLLWGLRHSTLLAQSVLSEYFASHGYRVAAVEPMELRRPYPWLEQPAVELNRTIDLWVGDLQAALRHVLPSRLTAAPPVGLLSWSYGGVSAALLASQDRRVQALVSFDSTGNWTVERLAGRSDWVPATFRAELLEMRIPREDSRSLFDLTPDIRATRLTFSELGHGNFNAVESFLPAIVGLEPVPAWSVGGGVARIGYESVARLARTFLESHFHQADTWPPPATIFEVEIRPGHLARVTEEDRLRAALAGQRDYDPAWVVDSAQRLMDEGRWDEAIRLLQTNARHHPASVEAQFQLGAGLLRARRVDEGREVLEKVLRMTVRHPEATRLLESLPAAP